MLCQIYSFDYKNSHVKPEKVLKITGIRVREKNYFKKFPEQVTIKFTEEIWIRIRIKAMRIRN
jgi:hypothetical protein